MDLRNIRAVLFDFDGVLMQSIEDHHRSWNEVFRTYGAEIGWEEFSVLEGQSLYAIAQQLCAAHGIDASESEKIGRRKNEIYLSTAKLNFYNGTIPLLEMLKQKKMRMALVTGAHRDRFQQSVNDHFLSYFSAVVTADDVTKTKPHPEPFLTAAKKTGLTPEKCLVIENAPLGIASAKMAGMQCIALTTTLTKDYLKEADKVVGDLFELKKMLESEIKPLENNN